MAVLKGIEITVQASDQALQEFDDIVEDDQSGTYQHDHQSGMPHLVSKYIEATSGARFTIKAVVPNSVKESSDALTIDISVDGSRVEKSTFQMRLSEMVDGIWAYNLRGSRKVTEAGTVRRPWMFSEIKCGEYVKPHAVAAKLSQKPAEEPPTSSRANPKKCSIDYLGTIIVKLWRKQIYGLASERKYLTNFIGDLNDAENFNEKELKGRNLTHSVRYVTDRPLYCASSSLLDSSLGEEEYVKRSHQRWKAFYVDGKHHPFAIFTFKYCSKSTLLRGAPESSRLKLTTR